MTSTSTPRALKTSTALLDILSAMRTLGILERLHFSLKGPIEPRQDGLHVAIFAQA